MYVDFSKLKTELGRYVDSGQSTKDIYKKLFQPFDTEGFFSSKKSENAVYQSAQALFGSILQGYQKDWTPYGSAKFDPNKIYLERFKVDYPVDLSEVGDSWLGFLENKGYQPKDHPLSKYLITEYIIPQIREDIELDVIFHGKKIELKKGEVQPAINVLDGIKQQLISKIKAGKIQNIPLPVITQMNALECVEQFHDLVKPLLRKKGLPIHTSDTLAGWYPRDKRNKGGYAGNDLSGKIDGSTMFVNPLSSMEGSKIMFTTPKENLSILWKLQDGLTSFKLIEDVREVKISSDFYLGVGFNYDGFIHAHVPDAELNAA